MGRRKKSILYPKEIATLFFEANKVANIEGTPFIFSNECLHYVKLEKNPLQVYLGRLYFHPNNREIEYINNPFGILEEAANEIITRAKELPPQTRAEYCGTVNFINCTINLYTLEQLRASSNIPATYHINAELCYPYRPTRDTPYMDYFLQQLTGNNEVLINRFWEMLGYLIVPDKNGNAFFLMQGANDSGIKEFCDFIKSLFTYDKTRNLTFSQIGQAKAPKVLNDACINVCENVKSKMFSPKACDQIKKFLALEQFTYLKTDGTYDKYTGMCKFVFASDHDITLPQIDPHFESTVVYMPCFYSLFSGPAAQICLPSLIAEKDYIAARALMAFYALRGNGYKFSGQDLDICNPKFKYSAKRKYDKDLYVAEFVRDMCIIGDPQTIKCHTATLHKAYIKYCTEKSYLYYVEQRSFTSALKRCCKFLEKPKKWRDKREHGENRYGFERIQLKTMQPLKPLIKRVEIFYV